MTQPYLPPAVPQLKATAALSLILGLVGFLLSFVLIGAVFSLPGLILGILHLRDHTHDRVVALWGTFVSGVALLLALLFTSLYAMFMYASPLAWWDDARDETSALSEWEGIVAPNVSMTTWEGEVIDLENLRGRRVLLQVWDTEWVECQELAPGFNGLYQSVADDDVVMVALCHVEPEDLQAMATACDLQFPLTTARVVPAPYDEVFYSPVTFIIDRNGVIQHVIEDHDDHEALIELATGPDFEGTPAPAPEVPISMLAEPASPAVFEQVWTARAANPWGLIAADWDGDGADEIFHWDGAGLLHVMSQDGTTLGSVTLPYSGSPEQVAVGQGHENARRLLVYETWGTTAAVFDAAGLLLWTYEIKDEINEAHWADLDGDGIDELILSTDGGLIAVSAEGRRLWQSSRNGMFWSHAVVAASKKGSAEARPARIVAVGEEGGVFIFDGTGKRINRLQPDSYTWDIMAIPLPDRLQIVLGEPGISRAVSDGGDVEWKTPTNEHAQSARYTALAHGRLDGDQTPEWILVESAGDLVAVSPQGEALARLPNQRRVKAFAIAENPQAPGLLVTLRGQTLRAYRMVPAAEERSTALRGGGTRHRACRQGRPAGA
jgi:peroxiredoxin